MRRSILFVGLIVLVAALALRWDAVAGLGRLNLADAGLARWLAPSVPAVGPGEGTPAGSLHLWGRLPPAEAPALAAPLQALADGAPDRALACAAQARLALAYLAGGDAAGALTASGAPLCSDPLLAYYRAVALDAAGQRPQAIAAWRANPWADAYLSHTAEWFHRRGDDVAYAVSLALGGEIWPDRPAFIYQLAGLRWSQGDTPGAVALLAQAIRLDRSDSAQADFARCRIATAAGDWAAAAAACEAAVARDPALPQVRYFLGRARLELGDLSGAESALRAELAARPADVLTLVGLGRVAAARGDRALARQYAAQALGLAPGYADAQRLLDEVGP